MSRLRKCAGRAAAFGCAGLLLAGCTSLGSRGATPKGATTPAISKSQGSSPSAESLARAHAHFATGVIHEMNDESEAALEDYYQAAIADPDNETLVLDVSRRFLQAKQPEKALDILTRAAARPQAPGAVFGRLGIVYAQLGKYDQAAAASRTAIKRSPDSLAGYQNLFVNALQQKREAEALQALDEAAAQPYPDAEFLVGLAELYSSFALQVPAQKEAVKTKTLAVLERADKLSPTNPQLRARLADALSAQGQSTRAAQIYLDLEKNLPDLPLLRERIHAKLASIYLRGSDNQKAIEQLEAIVRDDPTIPQAYYYLGRLCYEENRPAEAVDHFKKAIVLNPDFHEAWSDLARAQLVANKTSDALATLEKAREKFPQSFDLELWSALAYSQQKGYAEALRHFTAAEIIAKATEPSLLNHEFYFQFGAASERTADYNQAEQYFDKCLKLKPDFAPALNYLGYMWAEHGMKLDQARELIEKAVHAEPTNSAYLDSLGWVLFKLDQPKAALDYVLKAVELNKEPDATLYDHLGDIYAALHESEKAVDAWDKSLKVEPNDEIRKKQQKLRPP